MPCGKNNLSQANIHEHGQVWVVRLVAVENRAGIAPEEKQKVHGFTKYPPDYQS